MNDHALTDPIAHDLFGNRLQIFLGGLNICDLTGFALVDNDVVGILQTGNYELVAIGILADKIDRGFDAEIFCLGKDLFAVTRIHLVKKEEVAEMQHVCLEVLEIHIRKTEIRTCTGIGEEGSLSADDAHNLGEACALVAADTDAGKLNSTVTELLEKKGLLIVCPHLADGIDIGLGRERFEVDRYVRNAAPHRAFYRADLGELAGCRIGIDLVDFIYQDASCNCNSCHISSHRGRAVLPTPRGRRAYRGWWE